MTRRRKRRENLVAAGLTATGILIVIALLMPSGESVESQFSTLVRDHDVASVDSTGQSPTRELPWTPSALPKTNENDSLIVPPAAEVTHNVVAPASAPGQPAELPERAAIASGVAPLGSRSASPAASQSARTSGGSGLAAAASSYAGGSGWAGAGAVAAAGSGGNAVEPALSDESSQTAHVSGMRAGDPNPGGDPSAAGGSDSPTLDVFGDRNASLAPAVMQELKQSISPQDPIAVSGPEALSQVVLPAVHLDGLDEPAAPDVLASTAASELMIPLGIASAPAGPLVAATAAEVPRAVNPEPATLLLLGTGLGLAARFARRSRPNRAAGSA